MLVQQLGQHGEQPFAGEARGSADPHATYPSLAGWRDKGRLYPFVAAQNVSAPFQELLALTGERQGVRRAVEEPDAVLRLETPDRLRYARRRHAEATPRRGERPRLDHLSEAHELKKRSGRRWS